MLDRRWVHCYVGLLKLIWICSDIGRGSELGCVGEETRFGFS